MWEGTSSLGRMRPSQIVATSVLFLLPVFVVVAAVDGEGVGPLDLVLSCSSSSFGDQRAVVVAAAFRVTIRSSTLKSIILTLENEFPFLSKRSLNRKLSGFLLTSTSSRWFFLNICLFKFYPLSKGPI